MLPESVGFVSDSGQRLRLWEGITNRFCSNLSVALVAPASATSSLVSGSIVVVVLLTVVVVVVVVVVVFGSAITCGAH